MNNRINMSGLQKQFDAICTHPKQDGHVIVGKAKVDELFKKTYQQGSILEAN